LYLAFELIDYILVIGAGGAFGGAGFKKDIWNIRWMFIVYNKVSWKLAGSLILIILNSFSFL